MDPVLNFCPRCGKSDIDGDKYGSPGIGVCRDCGTLFSVLSVKLGEQVVSISRSGFSGALEPSNPGERLDRGGSEDGDS